jgi:hypothetical protein
MAPAYGAVFGEIDNDLSQRSKRDRDTEPDLIQNQNILRKISTTKNFGGPDLDVIEFSNFGGSGLGMIDFSNFGGIGIGLIEFLVFRGIFGIATSGLALIEFSGFGGSDSGVILNFRISVDRIWM